MPTSSQYNMSMQRRSGKFAKAGVPSTSASVATTVTSSQRVNEWLDDPQRAPLESSRARSSRRLRKPSATITSKDVARAVPEIDLTKGSPVVPAMRIPSVPLQRKTKKRGLGATEDPREFSSLPLQRGELSPTFAHETIEGAMEEDRAGVDGIGSSQAAVPQAIRIPSVVNQPDALPLQQIGKRRFIEDPMRTRRFLDQLPTFVPENMISEDHPVTIRRNHDLVDGVGSSQAAVNPQDSWQAGGMPTDNNVAFAEPPQATVTTPTGDSLDVAGSTTIDPGHDLDLPGPSSHESSPPRNVDTKLVYKIYEMFPDACPRYVKQICDNLPYSEGALDQVLGQLLSNENYPRRVNREPTPEPHLNVETQVDNLKGIFPDADPTYLRQKCEEFGGDMDEINDFIVENLKSPTYPTMKEFLRKQQLSAQQRQYTTNFKVEDFVKLFPNPQETFESSTRKIVFDDESRRYLNLYLRNQYPLVHVRTVNQVVYSISSVSQCIYALNEKVKNGIVMKSKRKPVPLEDTIIQNIPLLQDLAYHLHKTEIFEYIEMKKAQEEEEKQKAIANGLIETCGCCFDEEILPKDVFTCSNQCKFCRDCIKRNAEVAMGEGKCKILCMGDCDGQFSLQVLQNVLPPNMFTKLAQQNMLEEVKAAGIEELEYCPSCDFASIPAPDDKLFRCMNPECMKETCRECKEPSHVPLRCEEVEKDQETKARTYIENKMTEALLRTCYKCGARFFKEEGCNKMTCSCGAKMCYICNKPVTDYKHFNGIGGEEFNKCPLYTDNIELNQQNVLRAADNAKKEVDQTKLKHDPTVDLTAHYQERKKAVQQPHLIAIMQHQRHLNANGHHQHHHHHQ